MGLDGLWDLERLASLLQLTFWGVIFFAVVLIDHRLSRIVKLNKQLLAELQALKRRQVVVPDDVPSIHVDARER
jgi:hypothetical protein